MKKLFLSLLFIFSFVWILSASELYISPDQWDFGKNCVMEFEIIAAAMWDSIMWTDIMLDTSMEFIDFVPWTAFNYSLPPKVSEGGIISLWAFSNPDDLLKWEWIIWTIYLESNNINNDWYIRFYFKWEWNTADTNLSAKWWVDTLKEVNNGIYTFNWTPCEHNINNIEWWIAGIDYDDAINDLVGELEKKWRIQSIVSFLKSRNFLLWLWILILIIVILIVIKNKWEKNKKKYYFL